MLSKQEIAELRLHVERVGSDPLLEAEFHRVTSERIHRTTLSGAVAGKSPKTDKVLAAIRLYLRRMHGHARAFEHLRRYTGRLMFAAANPRTVEIVDFVDAPRHANPDLLHKKMIPVTDFKRAMLRTLDAKGVDLREIDQRGLRMPERIAFVNHTGQWLKPILRKLLKHPQPLKIEVYVCNPSMTHHYDGRPEMAEVLGVLEFLWSLPTTLDVSAANPASCLDIYTYDASKETTRLALFKGDLVAKTPPLDHLDEQQRPQGHPGVEHGARCILAPSRVELALSGASEFNAMHDEVEQRLWGGDKQLPGMEGPRISIRNNRFEGLACRGDRSPGLFDIDPCNFLCLPRGPESPFATIVVPRHDKSPAKPG